MGQKRKINEYQMQMYLYSSLADPGIPTVKSPDDFKRLVKGNTIRLAFALEQLRGWFVEYDSRFLLSVYVFYGFIEKEKRRRNPRAPETNSEFSTEILQAIALSQSNTGSIKPLFRRRLDFMKDVDAITFFSMFREIGSTNKKLRTQQGADSMINAMRSYTTFVRNWTYHCHAEEVMEGLFGRMNAEIKKEYGLTGSDIVQAFLTIIEALIAKINDYGWRLAELRQQKTVQSMTSFFAENYNYAYHHDATIKQEIAQIKGLFKLLYLRVMLRELADVDLIQRFSFSIKELSLSLGKDKTEALGRFIGSLSYRFGDLKERDIDKLLLDNPVRKKPFIQLDNDSYLCPLMPSLWDYLPNILEESILPSLDKNAQAKYSKVKALYAEEYVANLLSEYFPGARLLRNVVWSRSDKPGKTFETDNLLIVGSFALVFESKSGRLTASARRGGLDRLGYHIEELVLRPSRQNNQFIEAAQKGLLKFIKCRGVSKLVNLDFEKIKYYIPIISTMDFAGGLQDSRQIFESGLSKGMQAQELNLRVSMTDLASILEVLPYTAMKLHYFVRRRELESHVILAGIETDFLEFYLDSGFNIGEKEYSAKYFFALSDTRNLDAYFTTKEAPHKMPMPKPKLTDLWRRLLADLDSKQDREGWLEASFALLNCSFSEQKLFEKKMKRFLRKRRFFKVGQPYFSYSAGVKARRILIIAHLHTLELEHAKKNLLGDTLHHYVIILAIRIKRSCSKYSYRCKVLDDATLMEKPLKFVEYESRK